MKEMPKRQLQIRFDGIRLKVVDKETQQEIQGLLPESVKINHYTSPHETRFGPTWASAEVTFLIVNEDDIMALPEVVESSELGLLATPEEESETKEG